MSEFKLIFYHVIKRNVTANTNK